MLHPSNTEERGGSPCGQTLFPVTAIDELDSCLAPFLECRHQAVALVDVQGTIVMANRPGSNVFGRTGDPLPEQILACMHFIANLSDVDEHACDDALVGNTLRFSFPFTDNAGAALTLRRILLKGKPHSLLVAGASGPASLPEEECSRLRRIAVQMQKAAELEKRRISREIYDELAQILGALKLDLHGLVLEQASCSEHTASRMERMQALLDQSIANTKEIAYTLHPLLLDDLGLAPALEWIAGRFSKRSGIPCEVIHHHILLHRDDPAGPAIFRLVEEALMQAEQQPHSSRVRISLLQKTGSVEIRIEELSSSEPEAPQEMSQQSNYLADVKERFYILGGTIGVQKLEPSGILVRAIVPLV